MNIKVGDLFSYEEYYYSCIFLVVSEIKASCDFTIYNAVYLYYRNTIGGTLNPFYCFEFISTSIFAEKIIKIEDEKLADE